MCGENIPLSALDARVFVLLIRIVTVIESTTLISINKAMFTVLGRGFMRHETAFGLIYVLARR
jgi:hypothetical protein